MRVLFFALLLTPTLLLAEQTFNPWRPTDNYRAESGPSAREWEQQRQLEQQRERIYEMQEQQRRQEQQRAFERNEAPLIGNPYLRR
jgi:hypothetical protein